MKPIIGKNSENQEPIEIDIIRILEGRMLIQANSGGGKSYAIRKFLEVTHGKVQQIVLDLEGEFASLREKFDYILVGKEGDIPINIRAADLLAKRLLELNTSAIIDLYELKAQERKHFVKLFLDSLINAPKSLWHPCIVVVDEAHVLAPEKEQSEALDAVKDLATRGRKRGFALVAATQRISKLSKDVVAELNTKLIGRCSLDVDMKRAAFELGFTEKKDVISLRNLPKGEFYAFGPGLTSQVTKIKIDKVVTKHPEAGETYQQQSSAAPDKVQKVLAKLADLPQEAEAELKTTQDFKNKIIELKRELSRTKNESIAISLERGDLQKAEQKGFKTAELLSQKTIKAYESYIMSLKSDASKIKQNISKLVADTDKPFMMILETEPTLPEIKNPIALEETVIKMTAKHPIEQYQPVTKDDVVDPTELSNSEMKVLKAVVQKPERKATKKQTALMVGYSPKSGSYKNICGHLRSFGYVNYDGDYLVATPEGVNMCGCFESLPSDPDSIHQFWYDKLSNSEAKLLRIIIEAHPDSISREEIAMKADYSATSGSFKNMLGHMRSTGLIDYKGQEVIATEELFPLV